MGEEVYHRTQRVSDANDPDHWKHCTAYSSLAVMAAYTRGAVGPSLYGDDIRAAQNDQVGGLDLYDAKYALRKWSIPLTVRAAYGPSSDYGAGDRESLKDLPGADRATAWSLVSTRHKAVVQLTYGELPATYRFSETFTGPHAVAILDARGTDPNEGEVLYADPLAYRAYWRKAGPIWKAAEALGGGVINIAVSPVRTPLRRAGVRGLVGGLPRAFWAYTKRPDGSWTRVRKYTRGFSASCTEPKPAAVLGSIRRMTRLSDGAYAGVWLDLGAGGSTYAEVP